MLHTKLWLSDYVFTIAWQTGEQEGILVALTFLLSFGIVSLPFLYWERSHSLALFSVMWHSIFSCLLAIFKNFRNFSIYIALHAMLVLHELRYRHNSHEFNVFLHTSFFICPLICTTRSCFRYNIQKAFYLKQY